MISSSLKFMKYFYAVLGNIMFHNPIKNN